MGGNCPSLSSSPTNPSSGLLLAPAPTSASAVGASASKWGKGGISGKSVVSGGTAWPLPGNASSAFSAPSPSSSTPAVAVSAVSLHQQTGKKSTVTTATTATTAPIPLSSSSVGQKGIAIMLKESTTITTTTVKLANSRLSSTDETDTSIQQQQQQVGSKKKTNKQVPLFTNASGRSYR